MSEDCASPAEEQKRFDDYLNKSRTAEQHYLIELERTQGCQRPNMLPCKNPWDLWILYYDKVAPTIVKYCKKHKGHLFGWSTGWTSCVQIDPRTGRMTFYDWHAKKIREVDREGRDVVA